MEINFGFRLRGSSLNFVIYNLDCALSYIAIDCLASINAVEHSFG